MDSFREDVRDVIFIAFGFIAFVVGYEWLADHPSIFLVVGIGIMLILFSIQHVGIALARLLVRLNQTET